jgi:hypothetical protein
MKEMQPSLTLIEVPESGHPISSENPDFLISELRQFCVS